MEEKLGMPRDVVFVRHMETEANVLQALEKEGKASKMSLELQAQLNARPDWKQRGTRRGEEQAKTAGKWIRENIGDPQEAFDVRYFSPLIRPRETLYYIGGPESTWRRHDGLMERDWGEFGRIPKDERAERFPFAHMMKEEAPWFAQPNGGEALAYGTLTRVRDYRNTLRRKWSDKSVLAVAHGESLSVARYVFEKMLPEEWEEIDADKTKRIGNCAILWYTRVNPVEPDDYRPYLGWRRMIQPDNHAKSPYGGEWYELPDKREYTADQLMKTVQAIPRILPDLSF